MRLGAADLVMDAPLEEILGVFERLGLWLELARYGAEEVLESYSVEVRSVQAYDLHYFSPVSPREEVRRAASEHIREKIELASRVGAVRVVTVPAYGYSHVEGAMEVCVSTFRELADFAVELGVEIAVEALSIRRTSFLPTLREVVGLVERIDRENVRAMADTMHLHDAGEDVPGIVAEYGSRIAELHLRDAGSLPPGRGSLDFGAILSSRPRADLCLEYTAAGRDALEEAVGFLRGLLP
ncbi:MAG: sugar phosphate isomerase/epimerase [Euryarchaeota archaeon]|nr:sugar phosphate isomerase/epimerase [Euryarchaeota archaeon]